MGTATVPASSAPQVVKRLTGKRSEVWPDSCIWRAHMKTEATMTPFVKSSESDTAIIHCVILEADDGR